MNTIAEQIIASRRNLMEALPLAPVRKAAQEGGCGVVGLAASVPVAGRHLVAPARQMHNRGNGKGGGLAAAGLSPSQMDVSPEVLREATLLQLAYLDAGARVEVERSAILPHYDVLQAYAIPTVCLALSVVLRSNMAMVMGPTPPGTGVMAAATSLTSSKATSPTRR